MEGYAAQSSPVAGYMSPPMSSPGGYMPLDSKLSSMANDISKNVGSNKVAYAALFFGVIAVVLVAVALFLYTVIPAPPTLHYTTSAITAGTSAAPTSIVPNMNVLYSVTAPNATTNYVKFATRTSGYTLGVVYYVTNVSSSTAITVQTSSSSFNLDPGKSAMMHVDANGNSHRLQLSAL